MLAPLSWLREFVDIPDDLESLRTKMIMLGFEVASIRPQRPEWAGLIVGRVVKIERHPNAERLFVCEVDTGSGVKTLVTGADNVFEGALVPLALPGTKLPNGAVLEKAVLRGVESDGMLLSGEELQLKADDYPGADVHGILILQEGTPGEPISRPLGFDDTVIEFEINANRPDCLSIWGIAREIAVALGLPFKAPKLECPKGTGDIASEAKVTVLAPDLCDRYVAGMIKSIDVKPSPEWMQRRLRAAGLRAINNIVDITNYVMLETGQPMHAFDLSCVAQSHIVVRRAKGGEVLTTLDSKQRVLSENMLVIADPEKGVGLAGVMGGENSEITPSTQRVLFESARFTSAGIRVTAKALGLMSDAAARYAKGVDPVTSEIALKRALSLVGELGAGEVINGVIDVCSADIEPRSILVRPEKVNGRVELEVGEEELRAILERLGMKTERQGDRLRVWIPHYRGDIEGEADISEELARVIGYGAIPEKQLPGAARGGLSKSQAALERARDLCIANGANECATYPFVGPELMGKLFMKHEHLTPIMNPFGREQSLMRDSLMPGMIQTLSLNASHKQLDGRFFEIGNVHMPKALPLNELPDESRRLALGFLGGDFFALKGALEALFDGMGLAKASFSLGGAEWLHPGRKAEISIDGQKLGLCGELHPDVAEAFDIPVRTYVAEIDLDMLIALPKQEKYYAPLPRYPAIERDLALVMPEGVTAEAVSDLIKRTAGEALESIALFDVYRGKGIEEGKKSLAFSLVFRASERTLQDAEVSAAVEVVLKALKDELGAVLRA